MINNNIISSRTYKLFIKAKEKAKAEAAAAAEEKPEVVEYPSIYIQAGFISEEYHEEAKAELI